MCDPSSISRHTLSRRDFLKLSTVGAGLAIGINLQACGKEPSSIDAVYKLPGVFRPAAYIRITPDNQVTIFVAEAEMGQGVWTALPMLVAEELELDWSHIHIQHAPLAPAFGNRYTGGSNSIRRAWLPLRKAGAIAREMLISAAANSWRVDTSECRARNGFIHHVPTGKKASFGDLAAAAADLPIPVNVTLKDPENFRVIGTTPQPHDAAAKAIGTAIFGSDIQLEDMLIATVVHCPVFGGKLKGFDDGRVRAVKGVREILAIDSGVAVVADNFWAAQKAREDLIIDWDLGPHTQVSTESIRASYRAAIDDPAITIKQRGQPPQAGDDHGMTLEATYEAPFQAHATMEPMCCTAHVREGECDIWVPSQALTEAQRTAARHLMSKPERVLEVLKQRLGGTGFKAIRVHPVFLGGGFGRRIEQDFLAEAVQIAQAIDFPIKLIWSREEDIQHDFYRPFTLHRLSVQLDRDGYPLSWSHRVVGPEKYFAAGCTAGNSYSLPYFNQDFVEVPYPVPTGFWRSVSCSQTVFATECFVDELATRAGVDPYRYRHRLLVNSPRLQAVMALAADKAGWGHDLPPDHYHGIAVNDSHGSYVAQIVELSVRDRIDIHRVTCAIDCGQTINPETVCAQMEGSIVFGLTACFKGAITIEGGRCQQSNFHDFPLLRMDEMPHIDTYIIPSKASPGGVGEPGVPPITPAVVNALYAATGVRIRRLPVNPGDVLTTQ